MLRDGKFALWIDEDLFRGYSQTCDTYKNDCLSGTKDFKIVSLQVWGFIM